MTPIERMCASAPPLDYDVQKHLTNFSLITHGFGGPAMVAVLNAFKHYLNSMKNNYEKMSGGGSDIVESGTSKQQQSVNYQQRTPSSNTSGSTSSSSSSSSSATSNSGNSNSNSYFGTPNQASARMQNLASIELTALKVESKD